ncbi:MAG: cytochrome c peroxidase [Cellvibrio sp.]
MSLKFFHAGLASIVWSLLLVGCSENNRTLSGELVLTNGAINWQGFEVRALDQGGDPLTTFKAAADGKFNLVVSAADDVHVLEARRDRSVMLAKVDDSSKESMIKISPVSTVDALEVSPVNRDELALLVQTQLVHANDAKLSLLSRYADTRSLVKAADQDPTHLRFIRLKYQNALAEQMAKILETAPPSPNPELNMMVRLDHDGHPKRWQSQRFTEEPWACVDFFDRGNRWGYRSPQWPLGVRFWAVLPEAARVARAAIDPQLAALNTESRCAKTTWRLPTATELRTLFDLKSGEFLYPLSLPFTAAGDFWVTDENGELAVMKWPEATIVKADQAQLLPFSFTPDAPPPPNPIVEDEWDLIELRKTYSQPAETWPKPQVDEGVKWRELGSLDPMTFPQDNPYSLAKVDLGQRLFFDANLSKERNVACSSCHLPDQQWSDKRRRSIGTHDTEGRRNSMPITNVGYNTAFFWDGRALTLEEQALHPITDRLEMALTLDELLARLKEDPDYASLFEQAFGSADINLDRFAQALATFQRTLISQPAPFDRFLAGDTKALTDQQVLGLHLYRTKARCMNCHSGPLLTDFTFHNTGLTYYGRELEDDALFAHTFNPKDMGVVRVPSLRDVKHTAPYAHNGVFNNLIGLLNFYNFGMTKGRNANYPQYQHKYDPFFPEVSELLQPLGMTFSELRALEAFLHSVSAPAPQGPVPLEQLAAQSVQ